MERESAQDKSPFAEFTSEEYDAGELVPAPAEPEKPKPADPPSQSPKSEPAEPAAGTEVKPEEKPAEAAKPKEGEEDGGVDDAGKPKKGFQERINEITRSRREAERRAEAAERRIQELESRLTAQQQPPKQEEPAKRTVEEKKDPNAPDPDAYEYGELDSRYIGDLAEYRAEKKFNELRAEDERKQSERAAEEQLVAARGKFEKMIDAGSKKHEDFYEKVVIGAESDQWPLSKEIGELLLDSDVGDDIAYHLATNPEEAIKLHRLTPVAQARYFGTLEAKFSAAQSAASVDGDGKTATVKTPKAPAPVEQARGAGGLFQASADTDDFASFEQRANSTGR